MTQLEHGDRIYPMTEIPKRKRLKRAAKQLGVMIDHLYDLSCHTEASLEDATQLRDEIESAAAELNVAIEFYEHNTNKPIRHKCEDACGHSIDAFARGGANDILNELKAVVAKP